MSAQTSSLLLNQHERVHSLSRRLEAGPSRRIVAFRCFGLIWLIAFFPAFWFYHGLFDGSRWSDVAIRNAQNEAITYHPWGWQSIYLTNWGGVTQLLFWLTALLCSGTTRGRRYVDRFFALAWPLGCFIGVMFYAAILPGVISGALRQECGHVYPATVNNTAVCGRYGNTTCAMAACDDVLIGAGLFGFCQHGVPMLLIIFEGCTVSHECSLTWAAELVMVVLYACAYIAWNELCYWKNGYVWPYPFQEQLAAPPVHAAYTVVLLLFVCVLYFVGRRCNKKKRNGPGTSAALRPEVPMSYPGETTSSTAGSGDFLQSLEGATGSTMQNSVDGAGANSDYRHAHARVKATGVKLRVNAGFISPIVAWAGHSAAPVEIAELRVGSQVQVLERCVNVAERKRSNWLKVKTADGIVGFLPEDTVSLMN